MNTQNGMSGRVNVVLPDEFYELIKDLAESERRSLSQMTAILVEEALTIRKLLNKDDPTQNKGKGAKVSG